MEQTICVLPSGPVRFQVDPGLKQQSSLSSLGIS
jgi:hypothetical protein